AARSPKSKRSHSNDTKEIVPRNSLVAVVPSGPEIWLIWKPPMAAAVSLGRKVLFAMPAASATFRALFQAVRVNGLLDCAMSISSAREYVRLLSSSKGDGTSASSELTGRTWVAPAACSGGAFASGMISPAAFVAGTQGRSG